MEAEVAKRAIYRSNVYKDDLNTALDAVRRFVARKKLILVGGMAIDFALRARGSKLYSDDELPDYDFVSPDFHRDAYALALELRDLLGTGTANINAINAIHASTMKVRVHYMAVADITYMPREIFERVPTVEYEGLRLIHPHYQVIDQHISLSKPYSGPPRENILSGRWKKDMQRHEIGRAHV